MPPAYSFTIACTIGAYVQSVRGELVDPQNRSMAFFKHRSSLAVVDDLRERRAKLDVEPSRGVCGFGLLFQALLDQAEWVSTDRSSRRPRYYLWFGCLSQVEKVGDLARCDLSRISVQIAVRTCSNAKFLTLLMT